MLSDGHEDLDEANDTFRRVRVPALKMSHPWVRKRCGSYGLNSIKKFRTRAHKASLISVQVGVGQRCRARNGQRGHRLNVGIECPAPDVDPPALQAKTNKVVNVP